MLKTRFCASTAPAALLAVLAMGGAEVVGAATAAKKPGVSGQNRLPSFEVASGRVTYKFSGRTVAGSSLLTWADRGQRFRQDADLVVTMGTQSMPVKTWMIRDKNFLYGWQPLFGTVVSRTNLSDPSARNPALAGAPLIAGGTDGKLVGHETILGRTCEIREVKEQRIWTWKGLPLKMTITFKKNINFQMTATKLETDIRTDPKLFKVPAGYKIKDQSEIRPGMAGGMGPPTLQKLPKKPGAAGMGGGGTPK